MHVPPSPLPSPSQQERKGPTERRREEESTTTQKEECGKQHHPTGGASSFCGAAIHPTPLDWCHAPVFVFLFRRREEGEEERREGASPFLWVVRSRRQEGKLTKLLEPLHHGTSTTRRRESTITQNMRRKSPPLKGGQERSLHAQRTRRERSTKQGERLGRKQNHPKGGRHHHFKGARREKAAPPNKRGERGRGKPQRRKEGTTIPEAQKARHHEL